jgi:hypothetical protein
MADFRRWMMAGQQPVSPSTYGRKANPSNWKFPLDRKALAAKKAEEGLQKDPTNIEVIVERLWDSMISKEEIADYQR